jgi:hypothetical protein
MRLDHPTREELVQNFDAELASVRNGGGLVRKPAWTRKPMRRRGRLPGRTRTSPMNWWWRRRPSLVSSTVVMPGAGGGLARRIEEMRRIRDGA